MMNIDLLVIPEAVVDEEEIPLLEPTEDASEQTKSFYRQIPSDLQQNGFGYYVKPVENIMDLPDDKFFGTYLAKEYHFNCFKETCSFQDLVDRISSKVGGFRPGANSDDILHRVTTEDMGMIEALNRLFTRRQMVYFGW
jgi:hypothetical protein